LAESFISSGEMSIALKFCHDTYFYLGASRRIRDSIARVLPHYAHVRGSKVHGVLLGMYGM
jgi:hypothetical protein